MSKTKDTRQILIDEGRKALLEHGYDGVGLGAILAAAAVPKGSFYYFFESKDDFASAILDDYERQYVELRRRIFGDGSKRPLRRVAAYLDELERIHATETPLGGCLFGVLAQTAAGRSRKLRDQLASIFVDWTKQLAELIAEARAAGETGDRIEPEAAAAFVINAYEGALMRMKVDGDAGAFRQFKRDALAFLSRSNRS